MKNLSINRHSFLNLKNGKTLKNRIVVPPMASQTADLKGLTTDKTLSHYDLLAQSGASLIIAEYSFVHEFGRSEPNQLGISGDYHIKGLTSLADIIHQRGAVSGIQLTHAGGKTEKEYSSGRMLSPSGVTVPIKDKILEAPEIMNLDEIHELIDHFVKAAGRASQAGFDLIEIHAAHGYGLNQWLSPLTNHRTDEFGGSIQKNLRILSEMILMIKIRYPDLLISVRIPGQDFFEGGLTQRDSSTIALMLESIGVDILNVSSGIGGWRRPRDRSGEGYLIEEAGVISSKVSVPVIGVGGIESGIYIDEVLNEGKVSLAAVGRAILKDPKSWREKQLNSC